MSDDGFKPGEFGCLAGIWVLCGIGMGVGLLFFSEWFFMFF